jgi:hypothetical protein
MRNRYDDDWERFCPAAATAAEEACNNAICSTTQTRGDPIYNAAKTCSIQRRNYPKPIFDWCTEDTKYGNCETTGSTNRQTAGRAN